ncbi:MAG: sigma-70 family RNA polymerase sigma factor [Myxococcota bacterium]|nr:sigma-70 family RNA polymerase sigma factor [Myxococcota bacterium]
MTRGDRQTTPSLEALYDRYAGVIYNHCRRMLGSEADAEDALQETFMKAYNALSGFENKAGVGSWLYRIATNVCLDSLRSRRRKTLNFKDIKYLEELNTDAPGRAMAARQVLSHLIDRLDGRDLTIVVDHFITGMDQTQIAASLGISRRAVNKRLSKIRDRMAHLNALEATND